MSLKILEAATTLPCFDMSLNIWEATIALRAFPMPQRELTPAIPYLLRPKQFPSFCSSLSLGWSGHKPQTTTSLHTVVSQPLLSREPLRAPVNNSILVVCVTVDIIAGDGIDIAVAILEL